MPHRKKTAALQIALIYFAVGVIWIVFSDAFLADMFPTNTDSIHKFQTYKGWIFVLLTSVLIYWLTSRHFKHQSDIYGELVASENKFRKLVEQSLTGVYIIQDGKFVYVNPELSRILGYSMEELLILPVFLDVVHEEDRELVRSNIQKRVSGEIETVRYSFRCRHKDGYAVYVEVHGSRTEWEGNPAVIATLLDITERKRAEKDLLLTSVSIEKTQDAIYWINPDASFFHVNEAACSMLGFTREELLSMSVFDIDPDFEEKEWAAVWEALLKDKSWVIESRHQTRDGRIIPIEVRANLVEYEGELYNCAVVRDITERKRAEKEEKELKERLQLAISSGVIGLWDWDLLTDKVYYSPEWKIQIGYRDDEIGNDFDEWKSRVHPDDRDNVLEKIGAFIKGELPEFYAEFRFRHKDGSWRWILTRADLKLDQEKRPVRMFGSHIDITHLKESENAIRENQERLNYLLASNPTILFALKPEGNLLVPVWVSENIIRILGYTPEEVKHRDWWASHIHPEDREECIKNSETLVDEDRFVHVYRFQHKDGHYLWIRDELRVMRNEQGEPVEVIGSWSDITGQRREEENMRLLAAAFESTADGVIMTDLDGNIISVNKAFEKITGYRKDEVLGKNPNILSSGRQDQNFYQAMWNSLEKTDFWQGEIWNRRKNGEIYPEWLSINIVRDQNNQPSHYVGVFTDISNLKQTESELERLAHFDPLTGLPNRLLSHLRLEHAIDRASRHDDYVGVLFIDLDDFKKVNDSLGHSVGDELLVAVSERLEGRVRGEDTLGRLGGDEFLLLLENLNKPEDTGTVANQILHQLRQPFSLSSGHEIYVEGSIGISIYPNDGTTHESLLQNADTAMYRAKELGRNRFCFFTSDMGLQVAEMLELETAMRQGIENDEFLLHYQPKVDLQTGRISGAEALIRWLRNGELISPAKFIPLAERTGLIVNIGEWVIRSSCRQIKTWLDQGVDPVNISVNVSVRQFRQHNLLEVVHDAVKDFDINPELLGLEITESALMEHPEEAINELQPIRDMGVRISLDDFGTGFSNMAYLIRFPIEVLKIDTTFIRDIDTDPDAAKLVNSIIELARSLDLKTVAEGVETEDQLNYIRSHRCNEMQGFYFSKPVPAEEFETMLREQKSIEFVN